MAGATAELVLLVGTHDLRKVEAAYDVTDGPEQVPRGQPLAHVRGEQVVRIKVVGQDSL